MFLICFDNPYIYQVSIIYIYIHILYILFKSVQTYWQSKYDDGFNGESQFMEQYGVTIPMEATRVLNTAQMILKFTSIYYP